MEMLYSYTNRSSILKILMNINYYINISDIKLYITTFQLYKIIYNNELYFNYINSWKELYIFTISNFSPLLIKFTSNGCFLSPFQWNYFYQRLPIISTVKSQPLFLPELSLPFNTADILASWNIAFTFNSKLPYYYFPFPVSLRFLLILLCWFP